MTKNEKYKLAFVIEDLITALYQGNYAIAELKSTVNNLVEINMDVVNHIELADDVAKFAYKWGLLPNE